MNFWSIHFVFNFIEGIWWIGLGVWGTWYYGCLNLSIKNPSAIESSGPRIESGVTKQRSTKAYNILLVLILILFGISDFFEMATGAWWRPWWLLIWKGLCLIVGIILVILILKERRP